jgi:hypothetical protein
MKVSFEWLWTFWIDQGTCNLTSPFFKDMVSNPSSPFRKTVKRIYRAKRREENWQRRITGRKVLSLLLVSVITARHTRLYKWRVGRFPNSAQKQVTASIFLLTQHNGYGLAQLKHKIGSSNVYLYCRTNRFKMLLRICELGAMVTSKQGSSDPVRGMYWDSLGFRWEMWNGETKLGACKECIKRFRRKNLPEGIFQWPTFMQDGNKSNGTAQKMNTRPIFVCDHISLSSSYNEKCFRQRL